MRICVSAYNKNLKWLKYIIPRRLTLDSSPAIYRWLFWHISGITGSELIMNKFKRRIKLIIIRTKYMKKLADRTMFTEIGYLSGNVSDIDKSYAKENNLNPLNKFEKWLMKEDIEIEKRIRGNCFQQAIAETLGEEW